MQKNPRAAADRQQLINRIIAEVNRRQAAGDQIDLKALQEKYPEVADSLAAYFSNLVTADTRTQLAADREQTGTAETVLMPERRDCATEDSGVAGPSPLSRAQLAGREPFGPYRILTTLGTGRRGPVYLARDEKGKRCVALRVWDARTLSGCDAGGNRLLQVARDVAQLRDQHLCPVLDVGTIDGIGFICTEYVNGKALADVIRPQGPLSQHAVASLIRSVARAMAKAHAAGIVHGRLSPTNIRLDADNEPVVMDLGLVDATPVDQRAAAVQSPESLPWLAPEQIDNANGPVTPQSDIYTLGVVLYALLTGQSPWSGDVETIRRQILESSPAAPSSIRGEVLPELEAICLKMMARNPADRYADMTAVADDLSNALKKIRSAATVRQEPATLPLPAAAEGSHRGSSDAAPSRATSASIRNLNGPHLRMLAGAVVGGCAVLLASLLLESESGTASDVSDHFVSADAEEQPPATSAEGAVAAGGSADASVGNAITPAAVTPADEVASLPDFPLPDVSSPEAVAEWQSKELETLQWILSQGGVGLALTTLDDADVPRQPFAIRTVQLIRGEFTRYDFESVARLPALGKLDIPESLLPPGALGIIARSRHINSLGIPRVTPKLTTSELDVLARLANLQSLTISAEQIDDDFLFLNHLPRLRKLMIYGSELPDLRSIGRFPQLITLQLASVPQLDPAVIREVQDANPNLRILLGRGSSSRIVGRDPQAEAARQLQTIGVTLRGMVLGDDKRQRWDGQQPFEFQEIYLPEGLDCRTPQLEYLTQVTDVAFNVIVAAGVQNADELAKQLGQLPYLIFVNFDRSDLTDAGLASLQTSGYLGTLRVLNTRVTAEGVARFSRAKPLTTVWTTERAGLNRLLGNDRNVRTDGTSLRQLGAAILKSSRHDRGDSGG